MLLAHLVLTKTGGVVVQTEAGNYFFESACRVPNYIVEGVTEDGRHRASFLNALTDFTCRSGESVTRVA